MGGAGLMGSEVTRDLLNEPDISEVAIAELDPVRARALADELQDPRVSVIEADVRDTQACVKLVRGYDLLLNCTYFGLFNEVLAVACDAGVTYGDLLSTPEPRHYEMVQEAGIMAVSGLGATPGMTNILGRLGCEQFDIPDSVEIGWASFRPLAHSPGLLAGMFWEQGPRCDTRQYFHNGHHVKAGAFEGSKLIDFGYPIGPQQVYYMAHTETVALPRHFPTLRFVCVRGTWRVNQMALLRQLGALGLMDTVAQETAQGPVEVAQFVMDRIWSVSGGDVDEDTWGFHLNIEVSGTSEGRYGTTRFQVSHPIGWQEKATARMTGIPAAVQAGMILERGPARTGIIDATEYFTGPEEFLKRLRDRGTVRVQQDTWWEKTTATTNA